MSEMRIPSSCPFFGITEDGRAMNIKTQKWVAINDNGNGYKQISIMVKGKRYVRYIHRLVAECFLPNPNNLPQVNHIDGNKANNSVSNLEWISISENHKHAYRTGLKPRTTPKQQAAARINAIKGKDARIQGWKRWAATPEAREQWIRNLERVNGNGK